MISPFILMRKDQVQVSSGGGGGGEPGADGLGWTSGSYNASNGVVTFASDDGLGFSTGDLRGADGQDGSNGTNGTNGSDGADGSDGQGVPTGGTAGQVLEKINGDDFNTQWATPSGGGGGSVYNFAKRSSTTTNAAAPRLMIPWQTELKAGTDITWDAGNNTRLTIATTGTYRVGGFLTYSTTQQRGQANGEIFINGVNEGVFRGDTYVRNSGSSWDYGVVEISAEPFDLTATDYVEIGLARTSGANTTYGTGGSGTINLRGESCRVWVERVA